MNIIFIVECKANEEIRNTYFKRSWIRNHSLNMLYTIMGFNDMEKYIESYIFFETCICIKDHFLKQCLAYDVDSYVCVCGYICVYRHKHSY